MVLRKFQREAIDALRSAPCHVLCVSATGSGKSLIYEELASRFRLRTLLITPLLALARQQSEKLASLGLRVAINRERPQAGPDCWISSPEAALDPGLRAHWKRWKPELLVVDECHCLWDWGERFRPAFRIVPGLIGELTLPRSLWLTATLPPAARKELIASLNPHGGLVEIGSFALPPELYFEARRVPWQIRPDVLAQWLHLHPEPGIVFVNTRASTERVARLVVANGRSAIAYHAGLGREEKLAQEKRLRRQHSDVWVSTSAFGMGMDHSCLKWSLYWQAPPSLLALTQGLGRAARTPGVRAHGAVFWDEDDFHLLDWATRRSWQRRVDLQALRQFLHTSECRRESLTRYFEEPNYRFNPSKICSNCDSCLKRPAPRG